MRRSTSPSVIRSAALSRSTSSAAALSRSTSSAAAAAAAAAGETSFPAAAAAATAAAPAAVSAAGSHHKGTLPSLPTRTLSSSSIPTAHATHLPSSPLSRLSSSSIARFFSLWLLIFVAYNLSFLLERATIILLHSPLLHHEEKGDLIRHTAKPNGRAGSNFDPNDPYTYPSLATRTPPDLAEWSPSAVDTLVPLVFYFARPGNSPCSSVHYIGRVIRQAQQQNDLIHLVGPADCRGFYERMGVVYEDYSQYEEVYEWFIRNIGTPVDVHVRWFIMKRLMERFKYGRAVYVATEVLLYANMSQVAAWMFPSSEAVFAARWPSLRPPLRENQYATSAVAGHVALFSYAALSDFCLFVHTFFQLAILGGDPETENLVLMQKYNDMVPMGWYTFADCWLTKSALPCIVEKDTGITAKRAAILRRSFRPLYKVDSFCQPRRCHNSTWSNEGECVFDNNFSITTVTNYFVFRQGDKCPTSRHYSFYKAWTKQEQSQPIQFLGVHFQGRKKEFLTVKYPGHPETSWGSSNE